ncbi:MAG: methylenetetrahydrofolate reductase C-terminal domain-containing protein, partial [Desulfotomaculales bacterium]
SGGGTETEAMARRLSEKGVKVVGWGVPGPKGVSLCKLSNTRKVFQEEYRDVLAKTDSILVLACGLGVHTVIDATSGEIGVHPGCDAIFGGEMVTDEFIAEYCRDCGECIIDYTGGLCPLALCAKGFLNGPWWGAKKGKCEVDRTQDCGWHLIYERLRAIGRLELLYRYQEPKNYAKYGALRRLTLNGDQASFHFLGRVMNRQPVKN